MSSVTGLTTETATRREPIVICYDDSPDAVRAQQVVEHAGRPVLIVPPPR